MQIEFEVTLQSRFGRIANGFEAAVDRVVRKTAFDIEADAKKRILTGSKSGRIYERGNGKQHQASAPGEAPANDFGGLAGSIQAKPTGVCEAEVRVGKEYGPELEFGGVHMRPRPFLVPAVMRAKSPFEQAILQIMEGRKTP